MGDPSLPDGDRDRILRLIMNRCGDVLTEADSRNSWRGPHPDPDDDRLPLAIGEQILNVLSHMAYRLDWIESAVSPASSAQKCEDYRRHPESKRTQLSRRHGRGCGTVLKPSPFVRGGAGRISSASCRPFLSGGPAGNGRH